MTTKLTPHGLFNTPDDWAAINAWIERHAPEDRLHLMTAAMMAWNLAAKLTNPDLEDTQ